MKYLRDIALLLGFVVLAASSAAQDGEDENASPPPAEESAPDPAPDAGADGDDVFIPTEEIPADEEVTFPVNI